MNTEIKFAKNRYYPAYRQYLVNKIKMFAENRDTMNFFSPEEVDNLLKVFNRDLESLDAREHSSQSFYK